MNLRLDFGFVNSALFRSICIISEMEDIQMKEMYKKTQRNYQD